MEVTLRNKYAAYISLGEPIRKVLSREWLGSLEKEGSPLYNLRRNYKYDVDVNSGFNKGLWEMFRDSIKEKSAAAWITVITTVSASLLVAILFWILHLPPAKTPGS